MRLASTCTAQIADQQIRLAQRPPAVGGGAGDRGGAGARQSPRASPGPEHIQPAGPPASPPAPPARNAQASSAAGCVGTGRGVPSAANTATAAPRRRLLPPRATCKGLSPRAASRTGSRHSGGMVGAAPCAAALRPRRSAATGPTQESAKCWRTSCIRSLRKAAQPLPAVHPPVLCPHPPVLCPQNVYPLARPPRRVASRLSPPHAAVPYNVSACTPPVHLRWPGYISKRLQMSVSEW